MGYTLKKHKKSYIQNNFNVIYSLVDSGWQHVCLGGAKSAHAMV